MIVDLVRNDLFKVAEKSSVNVDELFGIYSFNTVHQMISTVSCNVKPTVNFEEILEANKKMNELVSNLKKDLDELDKRFSKKQRDLGKLAIDRTDAVQRVINKASESAKRCVEIASGSPLTESEIKATKKSEANSECPSIANPNYVPY